MEKFVIIFYSGMEYEKYILNYKSLSMVHGSKDVTHTERNKKNYVTKMYTTFDMILWIIFDKDIKNEKNNVKCSFFMYCTFVFIEISYSILYIINFFLV